MFTLAVGHILIVVFAVISRSFSGCFVFLQELSFSKEFLLHVMIVFDIAVDIISTRLRSRRGPHRHHATRPPPT